MPIYAYKCGSCGHSRDVLQKISDAPLAICPVCGEPTFQKQLTAAGFQLKGSGWYATDFKGGGKPPVEAGKEGDGAGKSEAESADAKPANGADASKDNAVKSDTGKTDSKSNGKPPAASSEAKKAPAAGSDSAAAKPPAPASGG